MSKYFTLGSYSISILHYSLYYWNPREVVFLRSIRAYDNWLAAYYGYEEDNERMYAIWWQRIEDDPEYLVKFGQQHQKNFENLNKYLDEILSKVSAANKEEILSIFNRYWELLFFSQPIGDINLNIDEIYLRRLNKNLKEFLKKNGRTEAFTEYLIDLTTPWGGLSTMEEELEFLNIVFTVKKGEAHDVRNLLKKHLEKYEWIPCWYDNEPWNLKYLEDRLNRELKTVDIEKRIDDIKNFPQKTKEKAEKIIDELNIQGNLLEDLEGLRAFTYLRTEVDLHTGYVVHKARPIYGRLAELLNITFRELKFLTPDEIRSALKEELSNDELIRRISPRTEFAVQIFDRDKQKILVGDEARQIIKEIVTELDNKNHLRIAQNVNELRGIGASLGSGAVNGKARVIGSISELDTMEDEEVLVVPSTSVDYVAAMKKAVAVVTEVGGITCHAAIVSRELGKPCVVNTQTATKVFKTGDILEVDAKNGVIRRLK